MKGIVIALIILLIVICVSFLIWHVSRPSSKSENLIYSLTVIKSGSGTVTSSPTGINCNTICSYNFNSGTSVTLTAIANSGYSFTGWSGDCSGTGICAVTMNNVKSVTATFTAIPQVNNTSSNETEEKPPRPPE